MRFPPPDTGASAVEYSLIVAAIAAALIGIVIALGTVLGEALDSVSGQLNDTSGPTAPVSTYPVPDSPSISGHASDVAPFTCMSTRSASSSSTTGGPTPCPE